VREDACCSPTETIDARAVALGAGIRHYVVDLEDEFRRDVVDGFITHRASICFRKLNGHHFWRDNGSDHRLTRSSCCYGYQARACPHGCVPRAWT